MRSNIFNALVLLCATLSIAVVTAGNIYPQGPGRLLNDVPQKIDSQASYLFYLSGKIVEQGRRPLHPQFGYYEYDTILNEFVENGFVVISEPRKVDADVEESAHKVANQVGQLIKGGVDPRRITVFGASQGSWIAMLASTYLADRRLNFVIMAACSADDDFLKLVNLHGNILSIYERTDQAGTCEKYRRDATGIGSYNEVETNTGLKHGFLYKPLEAWIEPAVNWARGSRMDARPAAEMRRLDKQWLVDPYWTGDMTAYDSVVAEDFSITHTDGEVLTKAEKREDIVASKIKDPKAPFRLGSSSITLRGTTAITRGSLIQAGGNVNFTNTYVRTNGRWQVVASQLTDAAVPTPFDSERGAIRQAVLDYVEGVYELSPERIERSVHPDLAKRGFNMNRGGTYGFSPMTFAQLVDLARTYNTDGKIPKDAPKQIVVLDVLDRTASAKLTAAWGTDYFHLAKVNGKWMIVNVLWQGPTPSVPATQKSS